MNTVENLLKRPFTSLPFEEKLMVKRLGPHQPYLNLEQINTSKEKTIKRKFRMDWYMKKKWLCGSESKNALFCFPCLLFGGDLAWTKTGIKDLKHLSEKIRKHEACSKHINTSMQLAMLGGPNIVTELDEFYQLAIKQHNQQVDKNRYVLSKLLDCVKFCGAFEIPLYSHDKSDVLTNPGVLPGLVNFVVHMDNVLEENLKSTPFFRISGKTIQNDILDCVLEVCHEYISEQISKSSFVSVQFTETIDGSSASQLALICRYMVDTQVVERFWGFMNVPTSSESLTTLVINYLEHQLQITPEKLVGQSYDGASATRMLHPELKQYFPHAYYIHSYAHEFNHIIQQVSSKVLEVRIFFSELSAFPAFFVKTKTYSLVLERIFTQHLSKDQITNSKFSVRTVNAVYENKYGIIQCLEAVQLSQDFDSATIREASALLRTLDDPSFMFWLTFFNKIMNHVNHLYSKLHNHNITSEKVNEALLEFQYKISEIRDELSSCKYEQIVDTVTEPSAVKKRKLECDDYSEATLASEVCDIIMGDIKERFAFTAHIEADRLLQVGLFQTYSSKFPTDELNYVTDTYTMLNKAKLYAELTNLYQNEKLYLVKGTNQLLQAMLDNDLDICSETVKLMQIVLTLPTSFIDSDMKMPTITTHSRVKTFLKNTAISEERLSALAMLSVEKNLLNNIHDFNRRVIEKFSQQEHHQTDFLYK